MHKGKDRQWLWGLLMLLAGMMLSATERLPAAAVALELAGVVWWQVGLSRLSQPKWGLVPAGLWACWWLLHLLPLLLRPAFGLAKQWPLLAWYGVLIVIPAGLLLLIHRSVRGCLPQGDKSHKA